MRLVGRAARRDESVAAGARLSGGERALRSGERNWQSTGCFFVEAPSAQPLRLMHDPAEGPFAEESEQQAQSAFVAKLIAGAAQMQGDDDGR